MTLTEAANESKKTVLTSWMTALESAVAIVEMARGSANPTGYARAILERRLAAIKEELKELGVGHE